MDARWRHWQGRQRAAVRQWPCSSPPQLVRPVGAVLVNGGTEQCLLSVNRGDASSWPVPVPGGRSCGPLVWPSWVLGSSPGWILQKIKRIRLSAVLGFRSDVKRASHAMLPRSREGGGALILLMLIASVEGMQQASYEQQRYDGWYNNLAHPAWGTVDSHLVRKTPPSYADGVYMMSGGDRPSPRNLSQAFMRGLDGLPSVKNRTAMQTFFGQVCATNSPPSKC